VIASIQKNLSQLADRWRGAAAGESANAQLYLTELCDALGVERPRPAASGYSFEHPIKVLGRKGTETVYFADLYKEGHFLLEAKDHGAEDSPDILMRRAFGQARLYAAWLQTDPPPYLIALDVGRTLMVWDRWKGAYGDYHSGRRIHLPTLSERPEDISFLVDIWTNPDARDPRGRSEAVTRQVAAGLADLASSLEARGNDPEVVARFLIRCVFTMFAEDVGLLKDEPFRRAVQEIGLEDPGEFPETVRQLWTAMDQGTRFGIRKFLRFNGHFFQDQTVLPLTRGDLEVILKAAQADWSDVEPSIMGTLLTRALNPEERHRLGAQYTPREFVERLVRPTVEEPIRERWTRVQVEVLQLRSRGQKAEATRRKHEKQALDALRGFHEWLRGLRFLDPACGSGNFLYVTLNLVKQVELEVLRAIEEITGHPELAVEEVGPWQFHGIEVKAWAREIAELTLWIGYHQWWRRAHGHIQPPEPVLRDTGTLEHRDAVLAWDEIVHVPEKDRPDPTPRIRHGVTGMLVPDPEARLSYMEYRGARPAGWPEADFIVGNPPYMGQARMRDAFGDGYVEALRRVYPEVPESADYVMYWWYRAAEEIATGRALRAGLITTNTMTQAQNRVLVERAAIKGARVAWAVADHPWVDEAGAANVRVAMTVVAPDPESATRVEVNSTADVIREVRVARLNADLTAHADIASAAAVTLQANVGLSSPGFKLHGSGFILEPAEAERLLSAEPRQDQIIKQYRNGRDLTSRPRGVFLIDFGLRDEEEARQFPVLYDLLQSRVKPERDANNRAAYARYWWRFGEPRRELREAAAGLHRYISTVETSKHRFFVFLSSNVAPDNMLICIGTDDAFHLGVLSSSTHINWALAAGGRLGIGNDPRYNKTRCFDPYPFPDATPTQRGAIADVADALDRHRKEALVRDERVTMTGMYNVVEKLRSGEALTPKERTIHEIAACGVLRDLHDELDQLVADAYGWPWPMEREEILSRLVALHDERVEEEKAGTVRWLRPEYQIPRFAREAEEVMTLDLVGRLGRADSPLPEWPTATLEQIGAVQRILATGPVSMEDIIVRFRGARREHVERHLETLEMMGEAWRDDTGMFRLARVAA